MRATPPEISIVSDPVRASRSPLGQVTKQPFGQNSTVSPACSASFVLLPPSVTINVRILLSLLTTLAAKAEPPTARTAMTAANDVNTSHLIGRFSGGQYL